MSEDLRNEVGTRLRTLLEEIAAIDPSLISDEATIDRDLEMNSVTFVEIQVALEEDLGIMVDPIAIIELNRFRDIVTYLAELVRDART